MRDRSNRWLWWGDYCRHAWRRVIAIRVARIMLLDVLGNVDQDRARPVPGRQREGLPHYCRDAGHTVNEKALLSNRGRDRYDIHLLKSILAEQVGGDVAGNRHDRHRIAVGIGNA